jgi:hypothetical protein
MQTFKENTKGYKILTDQGYKDFKGIAYMGDRRIYRVEFAGGSYLECTDNHVLFRYDHKEVEVRDLSIGDRIYAVPTDLLISNLVDTGRIEPVYDIIGVDGVERYFTNKVLSHNCRFVTKDETLISGMVLENMFGVEPKWKEGEIRFYDDIKPNHAYIVGLDPGGGVGRDFSAIQVYQLPDFKQVAEWCSNSTDIRGQVSVLLKVLHRLYRELREHPLQISEPSIYWSFENNGGYGDAAMVVINDTGLEVFPGEFILEPKRNGGGGRKRYGLNTTPRNKLTACMRFKSLVESARIGLNSMRLVKELKTFVAKADGFEAKSGTHDDLISATLLVVRMMEIIQNWDDDFSEKLKESIDTTDMEVEPMPVSFLI